MSNMRSGLSAALRFCQLNKQHDKEYSVTLLEKGGEIGNHVLSGNCFEPSALNELVPNWKELGVGRVVRVGSPTYASNE